MLFYLLLGIWVVAAVCMVYRAVIRNRIERAYEAMRREFGREWR
ncbi:hypothetical protein FBZ96_11974 [Bradyrhizobium stylosanthis]|uniref:Uncharacterized protein n=1 Tax=Bradyrhizobium stylosanthis TaxID=1803665 RepID=A0A560CXP7_9BRAD|nr:hypothetical protein FBZ96_11974 [Bradyrhizobium stylosanthis]